MRGGWRKGTMPGHEPGPVGDGKTHGIRVPADSRNRPTASTTWPSRRVRRRPRSRSRRSSPATSCSRTRRTISRNGSCTGRPGTRQPQRGLRAPGTVSCEAWTFPSIAVNDPLRAGTHRRNAGDRVHHSRRPRGTGRLRPDARFAGPARTTVHLRAGPQSPLEPGFPPAVRPGDPISTRCPWCGDLRDGRAAPIERLAPDANRRWRLRGRAALSVLAVDGQRPLRHVAAGFVANPPLFPLQPVRGGFEGSRDVRYVVPAAGPRAHASGLVEAVYDMFHATSRFASTSHRDVDPAQLSSRRDELLVRLAATIRALALTRSEISALPDNYASAARAGTVPDVFNRRAGWIQIQWLPERMHDRVAQFRRVARVFLQPAHPPAD